jgi:hypothetical protein
MVVVPRLTAIGSAIIAQRYLFEAGLTSTELGISRISDKLATGTASATGARNCGM